jgi:membrane protein implicated in regulation of membrane protease activity
MSLDPPVFAWALLAIVAAVIEMMTPHFGVIFVTLGAVAAAFVSSLGGGVAWQLLIFAIAVTASVLLLRPQMLGWLTSPRGVPSRTETLIGKQGQVTEAINPTLGTGRVNVAGEDWAARSTSDVAPGVEVRVVGADGIVLEVLPR